MTSCPHITPALPADAAEIARAIADGLDPELVRRTIYACAGIARYVRRQIHGQRHGGDTAYLVARDGDRLAGCVELRRQPSGLFLNYVAVRPEYQAAGLGRRLLAAAVWRAGAAASGRMRLDVFEPNRRAAEWYQRLGFRDEALTEWWELPPPGPGPEEGFVGDLPQAQLCQRAFGFSRFVVRTERANYNVGRLGEEWFRLDDPAALEDTAVAATLARLDPGRRLLALVPAERFPPGRRDEGRLVVRLRRMGVEMAALRQRLDRRCGNAPGRPSCWPA